MMKISIWENMKNLSEVLNYLNRYKYQLEDRGLKIEGLDVKVLIGDNEIEKEFPLVDEVVIDNNTLLLDLRNVRLKDDGYFITDKLPAKTMAKYYINKAITLGDAYTGHLPSKLIHDTLKLTSFILTNNIAKHLSLDLVDKNIISSYIKAILVVGLYDGDDNELADILKVNLMKSELEIVDEDLLIKYAKELGYDGFKKINSLFGGSARLSRLNEDSIKTILMNLTNTILRPEVYKALDYPVLFIPLIIEHYTNILYKRTALFYNINSLKRFIPLDEFNNYNKRLKKALV